MKVMKSPSETSTLMSRRGGVGGNEICAALEQALERLTERAALAQTVWPLEQSSYA